MKNLKGKRIGKLIVIKVNNKDSRGRYNWMCKCDCGNTKNIASSSLVQKKTLSCGCLRKKNKIWSTEEEDYLKNNFGILKDEELSKTLKKTIGAIRAKARRINKMRPLKSYNIGSIDFYYFLGWVFSDGYINENRIEIKLNIKDQMVLEYFKNLFMLKKLYFDSKNKYVKLCIINKKFCSKIINDFSIKSTKSGNIIFPNIKNLNNKIAFIKGFYEGDGSMYKHQSGFQISISSNSEYFLKKMLLEIRKEKICSGGYICKNKNNYSLRFGIKDTEALANRLKKVKTFSLDRKYK